MRSWRSLPDGTAGLGGAATAIVPQGPHRSKGIPVASFRPLLDTASRWCAPRAPGDDGQGPALELARVGDAGSSARGEAHVVGFADGSLRLSVSGLAPQAEGAFYEVRLMDGPGWLVSLRAFRVPASGVSVLRGPTASG